MLFIELVPVEENVATTRFKLRFETVADFVALVNACNERRIVIRNFGASSMTVIAFDAEISLENLRRLCEHVEDGHVMAETVALEADYTGERWP